MRILDPKFKESKKAYLLQPALAGATIFILLLLASSFSHIVIVTSLGASAFIAFTMPHIKASEPRYFIGSYIIGIGCGIALHFLNQYLTGSGFGIWGKEPYVLTCAIAVGVSVFLMTILNFEHPPAAALSLGLVLDGDVLLTAIIAIASITIITLVKRLLKKHLKDLL